MVHIFLVKNTDRISKMLFQPWLHSQAPLTVSSKVYLSNQQVCREGNTKCGRNCLPVGKTVGEQVLECGNVRAWSGGNYCPPCHSARKRNQQGNGRQAAALPGVSWAAARRGRSTHGHVQLARPVLRTQTHCRGLSPEEAGRRLITSGLFAGAGGETRKTGPTHLPQQGHFSKSKLTQRNNIISPPHLDTHLSRLNFCPNQIIRLMVAYSTFYDLSPKIGPQRAYLVRKGRVLIG